MATVSRGAAGEILAARYLTDNGYTLLSTNFHSRFGEIDIIASKDGFLVFAEVKARGADALYTPREAVTAAKQQKLVRTALCYCQADPTDLQPRFDVIEVFLDEKHPMKAKKIEHIENAFDMSGMGFGF